MNTELQEILTKVRNLDLTPEEAEKAINNIKKPKEWYRKPDPIQKIVDAMIKGEESDEDTYMSYHTDPINFNWLSSVTNESPCDFGEDGPKEIESSARYLIKEAIDNVRKQVEVCRSQGLTMDEMIQRGVESIVQTHCWKVEAYLEEWDDEVSMVIELSFIPYSKIKSVRANAIL